MGCFMVIDRVPGFRMPMKRESGMDFKKINVLSICGIAAPIPQDIWKYCPKNTGIFHLFASFPKSRNSKEFSLLESRLKAPITMLF